MQPGTTGVSMSTRSLSGSLRHAGIASSSPVVSQVRVGLGAYLVERLIYHI